MNQVANADERIYPPYPLMIQRLFKAIDGPYGSLMHAAIGLSGEAAELLGVIDRKNLIEEAGDIEFYTEALKQHFQLDISAALRARTEEQHVTTGTVFTNVVRVTGDILDIVKKSWVYGKDIENGKLSWMVLVLELNMDFLYELVGTNRTMVQHHNQVKLIGPEGRFASGFYTDAAAIQRADKQPGEDRQFFGKGFAHASSPNSPVGKLVSEVRHPPVTVNK